MKRLTVVSSGVVAVLVVAAVSFLIITTRSSPAYTNRVGCTGYEVLVGEVSSYTNNDSTAYNTATTATSFTTTTNVSATVGHVIATSFTQSTYPNPYVVEASFSGSCTFIR